jgi:hypothetical protein
MEILLALVLAAWAYREWRHSQEIAVWREAWTAMHTATLKANFIIRRQIADQRMTNEFIRAAGEALGESRPLAAEVRQLTKATTGKP